jgi:hypothetical protein
MIILQKIALKLDAGKIIGILFQKQCKRGQNSEFVQIWKAYRFFIFKPMLMIFFF